MSAFSEAWSLLKEFYFDPERARFDEKEMGSKGATSFKSVMGSMERPLVNALRENHDPSSRFLPPNIFEAGKHHPVIHPRTYAMERHPTMGETPIRVDNSYLEGHTGLPHYAGVNLSAFSPKNAPGREGQQTTDDITSALLHEHGHAAIDDEMVRDLYDKMQGVRTQEEAQEMYNRFVGGHEFGAYTLQNPGGEDEERMARFETIGHPSWRLSNSFKVPKAHINRGFEP
jgi:hypothetical protein